jgi:hypothetical protein
MAIVDPFTLKLGENVKFKTLSNYDGKLWNGTVTGLLTYDDAVLREDILPVYREMAKSIANLAPIEDLHYASMRIMENNGISTFKIIALEFIDPSTLVVNDVYEEIDIRIYGSAATEIPTILNLLKIHGYRCQYIAPTK